jgi:hypothetical protein
VLECEAIFLDRERERERIIGLQSDKQDPAVRRKGCQDIAK